MHHPTNDAESRRPSRSDPHLDRRSQRDARCIIDPDLERELLPDVDRTSASTQLASLERLGVTIVVTVTQTELSGADARELVAQLTEHVDPAGVRNFVFDLQSVGYLDSSCVGALVEFLTTLQEAGGRIALVNAAQNVECLFRLTQLDRLFPICRDTMTAIASVERPPAMTKKRRLFGL